MQRRTPQIMRKGGAHVRSRGARRQKEKRELKREVRER